MKDDAKKIKNLNVSANDRKEGLGIRNEATYLSTGEVEEDGEQCAPDIASEPTTGSRTNQKRKSVEEGISSTKKSQNKLIEYLKDKNQVEQQFVIKITYPFI